MIKKLAEKEKAIALRKQGKSLREILLYVPVAKSTLSLWLREVGLSKKQEQRLTEKRIQAQKRGAAKRREVRIESSKEILQKAKKEVGSVSDRELWLLGIALYWAEGAKQKDWNVSQSVQFTNSDPLMVKVFLLWLTKSLKISESDIIVSLAIHENNKHRIPAVIEFWHTLTGFKWDISGRVYFKHHKPKTGRWNMGENYYGAIRIVVRSSTNLNRKIKGWVQGVCSNWGIV